MGSGVCDSSPVALSFTTLRCRLDPSDKKKGVSQAPSTQIFLCNQKLLLGSLLDAIVHGFSTFLLGAAFLVTLPAIFLGGHGQRFLRLPFFFTLGVLGMAAILATVCLYPGGSGMFALLNSSVQFIESP